MDDARHTFDRSSHAFTASARGARPGGRLGIILGPVLGTVAIIAVASVGATHYLATAELGENASREVRQRFAGTPDPETTGSIASAARSVRFDPCRAAARFPAAP